jgi:hypothetical protein
VSAPATLCRELRRLRDHGLAFDQAWNEAISVAIRVDCNARDWLDVLNLTREGWRAAYDREPSRRCENAASMVSLDLNGNGHEFEDPDHRSCLFCGLRVPEFLASGKRKKRNSLYCSHECQRNANKRGAVVELIA